MDPDPYLWLTDPDPDPGGPKTYVSDGSGSATLLNGIASKNRTVPMHQNDLDLNKMVIPKYCFVGENISPAPKSSRQSGKREPVHTRIDNLLEVLNYWSVFWRENRHCYYKKWNLPTGQRVTDLSLSLITRVRSWSLKGKIRLRLCLS
jgi:hypothetical protein